MLPDLSRLAKQPNRPPRPRSPTPPADGRAVAPRHAYGRSVPILEAAWGALLARSTTAPIEFKLIAPRPGNDDWIGTFRLEKEIITLNFRERSRRVFSSSNCVKIDLSGGLINLGNLFYIEGVRKCDMAPVPTAGEAGGHGSIVLQMCDAVALQLKRPIDLIDASEFPARLKPRVATDSMSSTLALLRGYGYYEARGYFSMQAGDYYAGKLTGDELVRELARVQAVDLMWCELLPRTVHI